jgi:hypothetical protein
MMEPNIGGFWYPKEALSNIECIYILDFNVKIHVYGVPFDSRRAYCYLADGRWTSPPAAILATTSTQKNLK